ncbi:MAG TPA: hypothetical protein VEK57_03540 [Thermoanaerobaculia bacterium]|nr:hypothetical protein [Thermoanaerobaculia bacterium]
MSAEHVSVKGTAPAAAVVAASGPTIPLQTIAFNVPHPSATANYSLPLYQGAGYRSDFSTWAILQSGGFMKFNLQLPSQQGAVLIYELCSSTTGGQSNCPITITVNGTAIVSGFDPHNPNFYGVAWYVSASLLQAGANTIVVTLDSSATTQVFMRAAGAVGYNLL